MGTVASHTSRLRCFLQFLEFDQNPDCVRGLEISQIEAFLHRCAKTNTRYSMQHVVSTLRAYLRRAHALGILPRTLHLQIDTPRVYRLERLPRAIPWKQLEALLCSIDRSEPHGLRDFTLLYLAAAYGLRSSELVRLTLDDIDWRGCSLMLAGTKNRHAIRLPMTDETANILVTYLRNARPANSHRQLFLRMRAPGGPAHADRSPRCTRTPDQVKRYRTSQMRKPCASPLICSKSSATRHRNEDHWRRSRPS
jgi:integrase/recombinase XerD